MRSDIVYQVAQPDLQNTGDREQDGETRIGDALLNRRDRVDCYLRIVGQIFLAHTAPLPQLADAFSDLPKRPLRPSSVHHRERQNGAMAFPRANQYTGDTIRPSKKVLALFAEVEEIADQLLELKNEEDNLREMLERIWRARVTGIATLAMKAQEATKADNAEVNIGANASRQIAPEKAR